MLPEKSFFFFFFFFLTNGNTMSHINFTPARPNQRAAQRPTVCQPAPWRQVMDGLMNYNSVSWSRHWWSFVADVQKDWVVKVTLRGQIIKLQDKVVRFLEWNTASITQIHRILRELSSRLTWDWEYTYYISRRPSVKLNDLERLDRWGFYCLHSSLYSDMQRCAEASTRHWHCYWPWNIFRYFSNSWGPHWGPTHSVLTSDSTNQVVLLELTAPWEDWTEEAHERKKAKYLELVEACR